jgi:hypothetical protein
MSFYCSSYIFLPAYSMESFKLKLFFFFLLISQLYSVEENVQETDHYIQYVAEIVKDCSVIVHASAKF